MVKATEIKTTSPAYNRTPIEGDNRLIALPWCGKINLRGQLSNRQFVEPIETTLSMAVPDQANSCTENDDSTLYWLGPNEWLLHCPLSATDRTISKLKTALSGTHSAVVDVTDYYAVLRLTGADSTALLAKACPLDLHPQVFATGACTQTRFGHASILLHKISSTPTYDIQVRWSFTEYVWDYLVSGMSTL